MICKNRAKIIGVFEQNRLSIKQFWNPEWSDVKVLFKWFKQERNGSVLKSRPLLVIIFVLPKL
jgi:hypothetical protein